jgi:hypothetical protein
VGSAAQDGKTASASEGQSHQHVNDEEINYFSLLQSLSIAYFNEGVENEHLKDYELALQSYERSKAFAFKVFESSGGANNAMLMNASRSLDDVK